MVILTHGEKGAVLFGPGEEVAAVPPRVAAVSSVGCGDAFIAGFIHGMSRDMPPAESLRFAVACGAAKAALPGTQMPARTAVLHLLPQVAVISPERFQI